MIFDFRFGDDGGGKFCARGEEATGSVTKRDSVTSQCLQGCRKSAKRDKVCTKRDKAVTRRDRSAGGPNVQGHRRPLRKRRDSSFFWGEGEGLVEA